MKTRNKTGMSHEVCTGCSCCLLSCPVWNRTKDRSLTAQGRNKALQAGASVEDISAALDACLLCGTCEQNCPEGNDIVGLTIENRRLLNETRKDYPTWYPKPGLREANGVGRVYKGIILLTPLDCAAPEDGKASYEAALKLIGKESSLASDNGGDILRLIEAGLPVKTARLADFIKPLKDAKKLIVAQGSLRRHLKEWLPGKKIVGLGTALLSIDSVRRLLNAEDLYVIESCGYHSDYARLVGFYDRLRLATGAQINLDLQRLAVPTGTSSLQASEEMETAGCLEQVRWILHNRNIKRIVVESAADIAAFKKVTDIPVVHLAHLAGR